MVHGLNAHDPVLATCNNPMQPRARRACAIQQFGSSDARTACGLFRHYRIIVKLVLTIGATVLLMLHQFRQFTAVAGVVR